MSQLASGEVFGDDQPISLLMLGSDRSREALEGVAMELEDSLFPLLREVSCQLRWPHTRLRGTQAASSRRRDEATLALNKAAFELVSSLHLSVFSWTL